MQKFESQFSEFAESNIQIEYSVRKFALIIPILDYIPVRPLDDSIWKYDVKSGSVQEWSLWLSRLYTRGLSVIHIRLLKSALFPKGISFEWFPAYSGLWLVHRSTTWQMFCIFIPPTEHFVAIICHYLNLQV